MRTCANARRRADLHWLPREIPAVLVALLTLGLGACSSVNREVHFVKSVDADGFPVNYFRIRVEGNTALSSARYLSGYFPENAVDIYFGQIPQPDRGEFWTAQSTPAAGAGQAATLQGTATSPEPVTGPPGTKLILLLSSRAEDVAGEIADIAQNAELMRNVTKLFYRDKLSEAAIATNRQKQSTERLAALRDIAESSLAGIAANQQREVAQARLLLFLNQSAFYFGNKTPFESLTDAANWYSHNRDSLVGRQ